jgi:hypothetical protein
MGSHAEADVIRLAVVGLDVLMIDEQLLSQSSKAPPLPFCAVVGSSIIL